MHLGGDRPIISAYWTPGHLDVTDAPLRYAPPKPAWIDRVPRASVRRMDDADRLARRRMTSHAIVDPSEIGVLPPIVVTEIETQTARATRRLRSGVAGAYGALARRLSSPRVTT